MGKKAKMREDVRRRSTVPMKIKRSIAYLESKGSKTITSRSAFAAKKLDISHHSVLETQIYETEMPLIWMRRMIEYF